MKFAGVDSIASAQRYRGADLWVSRDERGHLPEGELFESDLIGCSVFDRATGRPFGTVTGLARYGGPALLEVQGERGEVLVPFVPAICVSVDTTDRSILVDLPEGLLEL